MKAAPVVPLLAFLIGGCTVGPDYIRPAILSPDNHRGVVEPPRAESLASSPEMQRLWQEQPTPGAPGGT